MPTALLGICGGDPFARDPKPSTRAQHELKNRIALLAQVGVLREGGMSWREIRRLLGSKASKSTIRRHWEAFSKRGLSALLPQWQNAGRRPLLFSLPVSDVDLAAVAKLAVTVGSAARAWRAYVRSAACSKALAGALASRKTIPASLVKAVEFRRLAATLLLGRDFAALEVKKP